MGYSQADKERSRERILSEAAEQIKDAGLESVSVGKLMRRANLTHGGFYGHFASRADLLAHALERALDEGAVAFAANKTAVPANFVATVKGYLSRKHRDSRTTGCAIAALAGDVARADEAAREVMSARIERFVSHMKEALGGDEEKAMLVVSAMIGAVLVSRLMTDEKRSDAVLSATKHELLAMEEKH